MGTFSFLNKETTEQMSKAHLRGAEIGEGRVQNLLDTYPLLKHIRHMFGDSGIKDAVRHYIEAVNKAGG